MGKSTRKQAAAIRVLVEQARRVRSTKTKQLNDAELQVFFDGFNEDFFGNKIRGVKVRFTDAKIIEQRSKQNCDALWAPNTRDIWIDKKYASSENVTCILLLHEMAHAALDGTYIGHPTKNPGHGMIYHAEIYRLFMAGAYDDLL